MKIYLTGDVGRHEENYRARVSGLGVHAYGDTEDEAKDRAEMAAGMKLDIWYMQGVLAERLTGLGVRFEDDEVLDERTARPRSEIEMELTAA